MIIKNLTSKFKTYILYKSVKYEIYKLVSPFNVFLSAQAKILIQLHINFL